MADEFAGTELPSDGNGGKQQVGVFETRDIKNVAGYPTAALTDTTETMTVTISRRYYLKGNVDFHIETRIKGGDPSDPTATSPIIEATERIATYFPKDTVIKVNKVSTEPNGRVWLIPN